MPKIAQQSATASPVDRSTVRDVYKNFLKENHVSAPLSFLQGRSFALAGETILRLRAMQIQLTTASETWKEKLWENAQVENSTIEVTSRQGTPLKLPIQQAESLRKKTAILTTTLSSIQETSEQNLELAETNLKNATHNYYNDNFNPFNKSYYVIEALEKAQENYKKSQAHLAEARAAGSKTDLTTEGIQQLAEQVLALVKENSYNAVENKAIADKKYESSTLPENSIQKTGHLETPAQAHQNQMLLNEITDTLNSLKSPARITEALEETKTIQKKYDHFLDSLSHEEREEINEHFLTPDPFENLTPENINFIRETIKDHFKQFSDLYDRDLEEKQVLFNKLWKDLTAININSDLEEQERKEGMYEIVRKIESIRSWLLNNLKRLQSIPKITDPAKKLETFLQGKFNTFDVAHRGINRIPKKDSTLHQEFSKKWENFTKLQYELNRLNSKLTLPEKQQEVEKLVRNFESIRNWLDSNSELLKSELDIKKPTLLEKVFGNKENL